MTAGTARRARHAAACVLALTLTAWGAGPPPLSAEPTGDAPAGQLTIRAIQGTPGAPKIGEAEVRVDLMHQGLVMDSIEAHLDENGVGIVDIPLGASVTPKVTVAHADVSYLQTGQLMNRDNPTQEVEVVCYETTDEEPVWTLGMRHVMLVRDAQGLAVTEIVQVHNPAKRTWIGSPRGYEKPATTSLLLPESAHEIALGNGFHGWCCTSAEPGKLVNHLPLMPGTTEQTFSYRVGSSAGELSLEFGAPVTTEHMMIIVPKVVPTVGSQGLEPGGETRIADTDVRYFAASAIPPNSRRSVTVIADRASGMAAAATETERVERLGDMAKWIAAGGGAVILLGAGLLFAFRRHAPGS